MRYSIFTYEKHKESPVFATLINKCNERHFVQDDENPEIVFFVGGDGTFFRAVQHFINKLDTALFVGIDIGTLGFFYDFEPKDIDFVFELIEKKTYRIRQIKLISAHAIYEDGEDNYYAINEVRIENPFHTLTSDVLINNEHFEKFRGNGLIVASPLGSSAYNKSLGGAVVSPSIDALEITEIASIQNNAFRSLGSSLVVPGNSTITFMGDFSNVIIGYDFDTIKREGLRQLDMTMSEKKVNVVYSIEHSYIKKLKDCFTN